MDWSQQLFAAVLLGALLIGRAPWTIAAIMAFNLVGTVALSDFPEAVMCLDIMSFALLIGGGWRSNAVAALFVTMAAIEVIAHRLQLNNAAIYTITDAAAYLQCGVISGADRGMGRINRAVRGRGLGGSYSVAGGRNPGFGLACNSQANGW